MRIAITFAATEKYLEGMPWLIPALSQNVAELARRRKVEVAIFAVGDDALEEKVRPLAVENGLAQWMGKTRCEIHFKTHWAKDGKKYEPAQNQAVASMRMAGVNAARAWGADALWFLDADVIPPANALACSLEMTEFDAGYYSVAFCPYPSQGGGSFLGGHGSARSPIFPDFGPDEREVPDELKAEFEEAVKLYEAEKNSETYGSMQEIRRKIEKTCPPLYGANIMKHNAEFGWRRRGWYDFAYPAIGEGAVLPTSWWGFGCTLFAGVTIPYIDFVGYNGRGTEDLFVGYEKLERRGFRSVVIPHCPVSHILRDEETGEVELCYAYHESVDDETRGHLRRKRMPLV